MTHYVLSVIFAMFLMLTAPGISVAQDELSGEPKTTMESMDEGLQDENMDEGMDNMMNEEEMDSMMNDEGYTQNDEEYYDSEGEDLSINEEDAADNGADDKPVVDTK